MFEAKFEYGVQFKKIVEVIQELLNHVNFEAFESGMSLKSMDTSNVALVELNLYEKGFKKYRCEKPLTIGLSIENLQKILKCSGNDDQITLRSQNEDPTTLAFTFESKYRISEFQLNLIPLDQENLFIPFLKYQSEITMPSNEFTKICRELGNINDTIGMETSYDGIKFYVKGDIGEGYVSIKSNYSYNIEDMVECQVEEPVNLSFDVRYLNIFNKASALSPQVVICMSQDQPLAIEYQIQNLGKLTFHLGPKT